jgi:hypothetical protein
MLDQKPALTLASKASHVTEDRLSTEQLFMLICRGFVINCLESLKRIGVFLSDF